MQRDEPVGRVEIPPGTLHMLILKTLSRQPLHGYAIAREIQRNSDDVLRVEEGSLYPALQKMLLKGWVTAEWVAAGPKRRARVYSLTADGRAKLEQEIDAFTKAMKAIVMVIQTREVRA
jgi:PadR family transcriptional regulator, regulatory protein PadR